MIPISLTMRNFMSYQDEQLDFSGFNIACVSGDNGVGKSSLLEAITWAIWGKSRVESDDDLIRQGIEEMWVDFVFQSEKNIYRIVRKRSRKGRGKTVLEFQINSNNIWRSLTEPTIKETQSKIINTLNLSYEVFTNSSYLRQGRADEFTVKSAGERKEILAKILNLDFYEKLAEKAKEKIKERETQEQILNFKINDLKEAVSQKPETDKKFKDIQKGLSCLDKKKKEEEEKLNKIARQKQQAEFLARELNHAKNRYREETANLKRLKDEENSTDQRREGILQKLKEGDKIKKQFKELERYRVQEGEYTKKLHLLAELKPKLSVLVSKRENIQTSIKRIQGILTCPTCLRSLSKAEGAKIIADLKKEITEKIEPEEKKIQNQINSLGYSRESHVLLQRRIADLSGTEEKMKLVSGAQARIKEIESQKQKLRSEIQDKKDKIDAITKEGKRLSEENKKFVGVLDNHQKQEMKVYTMRQEVEAIKEEYGRIKEKKRHIQKQEEQLGKIELELKKTLKEKGIYEELVNAYGHNGVQAMIIENAIPAIEEEANLLLDRMTDGEMKIRFSTQRAKKHSEDMIETLDIQISDSIGARQYELFSGGEAFRINFAIRVALSKLLTLRAGAKLEFLAVDEGFGTLDQAGQQDLIAAINSISEDFRKIIVITHMQEIKNVFQNRIEVEKGEEGSRIRILN